MIGRLLVCYLSGRKPHFIPQTPTTMGTCTPQCTPQGSSFSVKGTERRIFCQNMIFFTSNPYPSLLFLRNYEERKWISSGIRLWIQATNARLQSSTSCSTLGKFSIVSLTELFLLPLRIPTPPLFSWQSSHELWWQTPCSHTFMELSISVD
jgi:hypothetical protein